MLNRRTFLASSAIAAGSCLAPSLRAQTPAANEQIGLGFIGLGGRGNQLLDTFLGIQGARVVALCEPDAARLAKAQEKVSQAAAVADMRELLDRDDVDAVVIATCNHWHCLAAIWACRAGKDVYVEKPLGHNLWEQEQLLKAARANQRMVQVGTQQRSSPLQAKAKKLLHDDQAIGKLSHVVVSRIGKRKPIGKRGNPLALPKSVNYDLWLGPAHDKPLYRNELHYDWHWDFNTGNGEMGNWGVHVLDDAINVALLDQAGFPTAVRSAGVRTWDDAGDTPNIQVASYENNVLPVTYLLSNVVPADSLSDASGNDGFGTGYTVFGEGGRICGKRGRWVAYDNAGNVIQEEHGGAGDGVHQAAFLEAIRTRDRNKLAAEVGIGHVSTAWCHLASIAALEGSMVGEGDRSAGPESWQDLISGYANLARTSGYEQSLPAEGRIDVDATTGEVQQVASDQARELIERTYRSSKWRDAFANG